MLRPSSFSELSGPAVADASVMINICACGAGRKVLEALPVRLLMAQPTIAEVTSDRRAGRADHQQLASLIADGLVDEAGLARDAEEIFASLVIGKAAETLDDGEAASIALAVSRRVGVVVDEKKATSLCLMRFPEVPRLSSCDLFLHEAVKARLGVAGQRDAIFNALCRARMRVQDHHLDAVLTILGAERAAQCASLPARARVRQAATLAIR